jgi:hypothetical protein
MAKFEVHMVGTAVSVVVEGAAAAYRWIDDHASDGDPYIIFGWNSAGDRIPVVEGRR